MLQAKTLRFSFLILCLAALNLNGQNTRLENKIVIGGENGPSPAAFQKAALKANTEKDYFSALKYYESALQADTTQDLLMAYASVATALTAHDKAEAAYKTILKKYPASSSVSLLKLGDALYNQGKYTEAKVYYDKFLTSSDVKTPKDIETAEVGLENCDWAMAHVSSASLEIEIEHLKESVNTVYSEFAPFLHDNKLYYSSYQFPFPEDKSSVERKLIKVQTYEQKDGNTETLLTNFNASNRHTAHTAFSQDGKAMYYTLCDFVGQADVRCDIFVRYMAKDGSWSQGIALPATINVVEATNTEPNVGFDTETKQEILFFASDRAGGKGKRDLYYSLILGDGGFSAPINLGDINTTGDDITPFYNTAKRTLFFSSDGRQGLGGFDIYSAKGIGTKLSFPTALPSPINTAFNDLYYAETEDGKSAYFSSNRPGALYLDTIGCCYDIFKATLIQPNMLVMTFDKISGDSLGMTTLELFETTGTNEYIKQESQDFTASFPLVSDKKYMLIATKDGYTADTSYFNSINWKETIYQKLYLRTNRINLLADVYDKRTGAELTGTTMRFVDLGLVSASGSFTSSKDAASAEQKSTNNTSNRYSYALDYNHKYLMYVTKDGYTIDSAEVSTVGLEGTMTLERTLKIFPGIAYKAYAFDALTKLPLTGTQATFIEVDGSGKPIIESNDRGYTYGFGVERMKYYRINVTKTGYTTATKTFNTLDAAKSYFADSLYLQPAQLVSYLPLTVYFDNDEPDKRTTRRTTSKTYGESYYPYYNKKSVFLNEHANANPNLERSLATINVDHFFEDKVKQGWENLNAFSKSLKETLATGKNVILGIQGYASPRANSDYNIYLTNRRVNSLINHFKEYEGGVFRSYITSGQLKFKELPMGEVQDSGISDNIDDRVNSVYSVEASAARHVEIKSVEQF